MLVSNVVVIFDFDKTLVSKDSFRLFSLEAAETNLKKVWVIVLALMCKLGLLDNAAYKTRVLEQIWKSKNGEKQKEFLKNFLRNLHRIENGVVVSLLKQHVANSDKVVVMSASPEFYLKPFVHSWAPEIAVFGSRVRYCGGQIDLENLYGKSKAVLAETLINKYKPSSLLVYTDHISDLSLIRLATNVRLVSPSRHCISTLRKLDIKFETVCP